MECRQRYSVSCGLGQAQDISTFRLHFRGIWTKKQLKIRKKEGCGFVTVVFMQKQEKCSSLEYLTTAGEQNVCICFQKIQLVNGKLLDQLLWSLQGRCRICPQGNFSVRRFSLSLRTNHIALFLILNYSALTWLLETISLNLFYRFRLCHYSF